MDIEHLTLATLGGGAAVEKWGEELARLAENVMDPNTEATTTRSLKLEVKIKPTSERRDAEVTLQVSSKLAPPIGVRTRAFFGIDRKTGQVVVCEHNANQLALAFDREQKAVTPALAEQAVNGGSDE